MTEPVTEVYLRPSNWRTSYEQEWRKLSLRTSNSLLHVMHPAVEIHLRPSKWRPSYEKLSKFSLRTRNSLHARLLRSTHRNVHLFRRLNVSIPCEAKKTCTVLFMQYLYQPSLYYSNFWHTYTSINLLSQVYFIFFIRLK